MAQYIIGDVHGCLDGLQQLLAKLSYNPGIDELWFVGDLINRGPDSVGVLDFIYNLPVKKIVLGNHDLHLLALEAGGNNNHYNGLSDILSHPQAKLWCSWLRQQPLIQLDDNICMVHAGIYPLWDLSLASNYAQEVHEMLVGKDYAKLLVNMYGNLPNIWDDNLSGWDRLRFIINAFVRMRYLDGNACDFEHNMSPQDKPKHLIPWYQHSSLSINKNIVFGHWASLRAQATTNPLVIAIDGGYVWGGDLVALNTKTLDKVSVQSPFSS